MATVPGAPGLSVLAPDNGKLVVAFTAPSSDGGSPITDYESQVDSGPIVSIGLYKNPVEFTGLTNGVAYVLKLRAVNAIGAGPWLVTTPPTPTATVYYTINRLTGANTDTARIAFSSANMPGAVEEPEQVLLYTGDGYTQNKIGATGITNPFAWTYDVSGLLAANGLRWVVGTFTVTGYGSFPVARQVAAAAPTTARNVIVTPGNAQLTVSWIPPLSDGGSPVTSYDAKLYIGATLINTYTNVTSPTVISSLANGTTYNVQVVANNAVGSTSSASVSGTPFAPLVPTAPTIDSATAGDGTITVAYTAPSSDGGAPITFYQYSLDNGLNVVSVGLADPFQITGLTNGQLYTIILRAVNALGAGPWSTPAYAMPTSGQKVFALGDRFVRVVFDSTGPAPVHVSSTGEKDILNPRSWNVLQLYSDRSGGRVLTGLSVKELDAWTYELLVLQPFLREGSEYNDSTYGTSHVSGTGQVSLDIAFEDSSTALINQNFSISIASVNASNTAQAVSRGYALKDIANVSISPLVSELGGSYYEFLGGTLLINSAGDYASMDGEALLRKLIMRRLISRKGDFFHLPDYGANLAVKDVFSTANLPSLAKDIERQVQQEPDVEKAKVTLTYQAATSILVVQVQARMRSTGQQTGLSMSLPLGGVKSF